MLLKENFEKKITLKKFRRRQKKIMKNYQACQELIAINDTSFELSIFWRSDQQTEVF